LAWSLSHTKHKKKFVQANIEELMALAAAVDKR